MRLLVAHDHPGLLSKLEQALRERSYAVDAIPDGPDALLLAEMDSYDLLILGARLTGPHGADVFDWLRARGVQAPVLALAPRDAPEDRARALDNGADDCLSAPFTLRELLARVRALLRRAAGIPAPQLRAGDLVLDPRTRQVWRAGQRIELTSKEYAVLEYFMTHPNQVLSRRQIEEHVWDLGFISASNVVDVYVRYLRRKLGDEREPRLIRTVRGAGYQLHSPAA